MTNATAHALEKALASIGFNIEHAEQQSTADVISKRDTLTQADQFFDWACDTRQSFKHDDHRAIVSAFCSAATIETVQRNPWQERRDHYDDLTKVTFPDGSVAVFNYKGEGEN